MIDVVEKVRALIARTNSDFKEEARTSAFIACKLIREHSLVVSRAQDATKTKQQAAQPRPAPPRPAPPRPAPREPPKQQRQQHKNRDEDFVGRRIHTKYASSCYGCGQFIDIDEEVFWIKGEGVYHPDCVPSEYVGRRGKRR